MSQEDRTGILIAFLIMCAISLFISMGGDGCDNEAHAQWMAEAKEQGAWVMW